MEELRELIRCLALGDGDEELEDQDPGRLYRVCRLATAVEHPKLKASLVETLRDWDVNGYGWKASDILREIRLDNFEMDNCYCSHQE